MRGADTENTAHCPYVGELAAGPEGAGELTTPWYEDLMEGPFVEVFKEAMLAVECCKRMDGDKRQRTAFFVVLEWNCAAYQLSSLTRQCCVRLDQGRLDGIYKVGGVGL